jgi:hypothetical protein
MVDKRRPTSQDAIAAVRLLSEVVESGGDIFDALEQIRPLHPKNNTFPGEVFMRLAADALGLGQVSADRTMSAEGLCERYLPECRFRGRDNRKMRFAVMAAAATHGGIEVDLLDEVAYWETDDFWRYAAFAAIAWIRAVSDQRGLPMGDLCKRLRDRHYEQIDT